MEGKFKVQRDWLWLPAGAKAPAMSGWLELTGRKGWGAAREFYGGGVHSRLTQEVTSLDWLWTGYGAEVERRCLLTPETQDLTMQRTGDEDPGFGSGLTDRQAGSVCSS